MLDRNDSDLVDIDENTQIESEQNGDDDEKKENETKHRHSRTPLMDIIDPEHTGKWVDIELENVEKRQSDALSSQLTKDSNDAL